MKKKVLAEYEAEEFLRRFIPTERGRLVKKSELLKEKELKDYPYVVKLISEGALHKTDVNGVRIAKNFEELKRNFFDLVKTARKKKLALEGILIQKFIVGREIIIGIKKDETFGHVIMAGLGGVFVELLNDVSFRICPITEKDADEMINELKGKSILFGFRGKPVNLKLLKNILVKVSRIPLKHKNIIELDINPFIINEKIGKAVDARMVLGAK